MKIQMRSLGFGLILASVSALAAPIFVEGQSPVYTPGQYAAQLDQSTQQWQVMPLAGTHLRLTNRDANCLSTAVLAPGLWLVGHDLQGRLELVAASDTALRSDESAAVAVRGCNQAFEGMTLRVPQEVLEALALQSGAVLIDD